jgi:hypothetical protein
MTVSIKSCYRGTSSYIENLIFIKVETKKKLLFLNKMITGDNNLDLPE